MRSFEQGELYRVRQGERFYVYVEENLLRELTRLHAGEHFVIVSSSDDDNLIVKIVTRAGVGFTLSLELDHAEVVVPVSGE